MSPCVNACCARLSLMASDYLTEDAGGVVLRLKVQPRSWADRVAGVQGDALRINLTAPPVDGKANEALIRFLAQKLGVKRNRVRLVAGDASRHKVVRVEGITAAAAQEGLEE